MSDEGEILFDQIIPPNQFIRLPATRLILETAPEVVLSPDNLHTLAQTLTRQIPRSLSTGAIDKEVAFHKLIFALVHDALWNLQRFNQRRERLCMENLTLAGLRAAFTPQERGQLINSALFLLEYPDLWSLPPIASRLSRTLLQVEANAGCLEELLAASVSTNPWKNDFLGTCVRCGLNTGNWRPVLSPPEAMEPEEAWRYARPENHVFLCRNCAYKLGWNKKPALRCTLAFGVWGVRFEAFHRWHRSMIAGSLPADWNKEHFPLWPAEYGGSTWEAGSGAFEHADPRPPKGVCRTKEHLAGMRQALKRRYVRRLSDMPPQKEVSSSQTNPFDGET
ncbi:MAG: hypothetical protein Fur0022_02540 [Anaerolineales bacterium]